MSTSSGNRTLSSAKAAKQDEFYTQLSDIANELKHYKDHFRGKVVLCNCDDPRESKFFEYFALNFNTLGLKKLITTSYHLSPIMGQQLSLFVMEGTKRYAAEKKAYVEEISGVPDRRFPKPGMSGASVAGGHRGGEPAAFPVQRVRGFARGAWEAVLDHREQERDYVHKAVFKLIKGGII